MYTESQGTVLGSHYAKFCQNSRKGCIFTHHYGYHTLGDKSTDYYDPDWHELVYLVSTSQTAFEINISK